MAVERNTQEPHRIFQTEWLHKLQVRYPWFCGYASAPLAFAAGQRYGAGALTVITKLAPLLAADKSLPARDHQALVAALLFNGHFVRRAVEVVYVNDYTGTFERDSRGELLYYTAWGLLAGTAAGKLPLATHGATPGPLRLLGACLFLIGQCGNAWCHLELRRLRAERKAIGSSTYIIPTRGPFKYISTPHYTFELLTWAGYAVHSGLDLSTVGRGQAVSSPYAQQ